MWKNVSGGWGGGHHFPGALLFDTTLSHHIPGFLGSMVPILYDLYREKSFFRDFPGLYSLGLILKKQKVES